MGSCLSRERRSSDLRSFPYRHVLITGASSGIGAAVAIQLAGLPSMTLSLVARNHDRLETVAAACRAQGATVHGLMVDVEDKPAMEKAVIQANQLCPLELVIANAGIVAQPDRQDQLPDMMWQAAHTNIMGSLHTIVPALKLLKAQAAAGHPAAIAVMSSVSALPANAVPFTGQLQLGMLPYAWTKHSLLMLGQGLEGELAGSGVKVFTICPGVVLTELATSWTQLFMKAQTTTHCSGTSSEAPDETHSPEDAASLNYEVAAEPERATRSVVIPVRADAELSSNPSLDLSLTGFVTLIPPELPTAVSAGDPDKYPKTVDLCHKDTTMNTQQGTTHVKKECSSRPQGGSALSSSGRANEAVGPVAAYSPGAAPGAAVASSPIGAACYTATAEHELRSRLGAITPEEAATGICQGLATGKGGLIAFPAQAVRTMKVMQRLPDKLMLKAIKKAMTEYNSTA